MVIKNFKESRELLDLKQKNIAEFFNIHFSTVSGWETGKDTIPLKRLIEYANKYGYSLDYLFGLTRTNINYKPIILDIELLSKNLRILRKQNKMTQAMVAEKINTTQPAYAHYELGTNLITTTFLFNLTKIYQPFSIDALFGREKQ
ncbi:MAG: helix-turn-helix transcriptional regulator [Clostridia bacterium]|nr:helix-turn-helix transcriptional regulator [Clostridia bacterium]